MDFRAPTERRVLRRWRPLDASARREAIAFNVIPAIAAVLALAAVAPGSDWGDPILIASLAAISGVAYLCEVRLKAGSQAFFGATLVVAFVTLAVGGPVPALIVWVVPDFLSRFVLRREPRFSPGLVASVSSYALAVAAGAALLELAGSPTGAAVIPALYAAGVAMSVINFCFARLTFAPFYQGYRPSALIRDEFVDVEPAVLAMLVVGVATAALVEPFGVFALLLLAAIILVPQFVFERIATAESAARLDRATAMRMYTSAIADVMDVPRTERRALVCAADLIEPVNDPIGARGLDWREADVSRIAFLALHARERWAGNGWPAGLPAEAIPFGSRVLAVARAWAGLTAAGTPELSQADAILALSAQSGLAFDPAVVEAASRVVRDEEGFAREPNFQPTLHRLPVPRSLRRQALPAMLPRLLDSSAA